MWFLEKSVRKTLKTTNLLSKIALGRFLWAILAHFLAGSWKLLWEASWGSFWLTSWLGTENCFGTLPGDHFGSIPGWEPEIALGSLLGTILAYFLAGSWKLLWEASWGLFWLTSWLGTENCFGRLPGDHFGSIPGWEPEIALGKLMGASLVHFLAGSRKLLWEASWGLFWFTSWLWDWSLGAQVKTPRESPSQDLREPGRFKGHRIYNIYRLTLQKNYTEQSRTLEEPDTFSALCFLYYGSCTVAKTIKPKN